MFRKPKAAGLMLVLLFVTVAALAAYSMAHTGCLVHIEGIKAGVIVLMAVWPLIMGIRSLRYNVRVSNDTLTISNATTKSVRLQDIRKVQIERGTRGGP
ncbi:MAG TPA: hypothetical protein VGJ20_39600, partial [Xanthobacteraceae bacterium]